MPEPPRALLHADRPYGQILAPFLGLSLVIHAALGLGLTWKWWSKGLTHGRVAMDVFTKPAGTVEPTLAAAAQEIAADQPRRYRLNYFNRVVLPQPVQIAAVPDPPPALDPPIEPPKPKNGTPKGTPKVPTPAPTPTPTEGANGTEGTSEVPFTDVKIGFLDGEDGQHLKIPPFRLHTLRDDVDRTDADFLAYPTLYIVADISTKRGMEDLYNWSHFFHDLLHLPNVVSPPWVLAIGEGLEDPYFLTPDLAGDALLKRWESMQLFPHQAWGDVTYDANHEFVDGVGVEELPEPQIYMADLDGYVRIRITGRIEDMSREEFLDITSEIKNQWGMNELEFNAAKFVIFQWQSQLKANKLGPPMAGNPELQPTAIPPFEPPEE